MPAAVMVATVATRWRAGPDGDQPAEEQHRDSARSAQSAITPPAPASTSSCLKPPPAATMSRMPAMPGSPEPMALSTPSRLIPVP